MKNCDRKTYRYKLCANVKKIVECDNVQWCAAVQTQIFAINFSRLVLLYGKQAHTLMRGNTKRAILMNFSFISVTFFQSSFFTSNIKSVNPSFAALHATIEWVVDMILPSFFFLRRQARGIEKSCIQIQSFRCYYKVLYFTRHRCHHQHRHQHKGNQVKNRRKKPT